MTASPSLPEPPRGLAPVSLALAAWRLAPIAPSPRDPASAVGLILAESLAAPGPVPPRAEALRAGWAVAAADVAGASPYSPVLPPVPPAAVRAGDPLPSGADAVISPDAVDLASGFPEVVAGAFPGEGVRRRGEDLLSGDLLARAGLRLTAFQAAAAGVAGLREVKIREPVVGIEAPASCPVAAFLARAIRESGGRVLRDGSAGAAHLVVRVADPESPEVSSDAAILARGLALRPGETALCGLVGATPLLVCPPRLDAALALLVAVLAPAVTLLAGADPEPPAFSGPLSGKISSQVGFTEVALLRATKGVVEPVAVGDLTLGTILRADAYLLVPPESEGAPSGERVETRPLPGLRPAAEEP